MTDDKRKCDSCMGGGQILGYDSRNPNGVPIRCVRCGGTGWIASPVVDLRDFKEIVTPSIALDAPPAAG